MTGTFIGILATSHFPGTRNIDNASILYAANYWLIELAKQQYLSLDGHFGDCGVGGNCSGEAGADLCSLELHIVPYLPFINE